MDYTDPNPNDNSISQQNMQAVGQPTGGNYQGMGTPGGSYQLNGTQYTNGGSEGQVNTVNQYIPDDQNWLNSLGWQGGSIYQNVGGEGGAPQLSDMFNDWQKQHDLTFGSKYTPYTQGLDGLWTVGAFNPNGQRVGGTSSYADDTGINSPFDYATRILGSAMGGFEGGAIASGYGAGATGTAIGTGAGAGMGGASATSDDPIGHPGSIIKAGVAGAAGGAVSSFNPAGQVGIDNPDYQRYFNKGVGSAVSTAAKGGNLSQIGQSALGSAATSGLSAGIQQGVNMFGSGNYGGFGTPYSNDDYEPGGNSGSFSPSMSSAPDSSQGGVASIFNPNQSTNPAFTQSVQNSMLAPATGGGEFSPDMGGNMNGVGGGSQNPNQQRAAGPAQGNPFIDGFKKAFGLNGPGAGGNYDSMAGNLMQMYQSWKNQRQIGGLAGNLNSLYGQDSPYAKQMAQTLMRQDAAGGRRSQVGTRQVELQARLAQLNSQNAPTLQRLYSQQQNNQGQMLQSLLRMGGPALARMYGPQGASDGGYVPSNSPNNSNYENSLDQGFNLGP